MTYWRRPGKSRGISASTNYGGADLLYVFTSSTLFDRKTSYTKFGAYAVLEHQGDYTRAAQALATQDDAPVAPPPPATPQSATSDEERISNLVALERARREARRRVDAEERGPTVPIALTTLRERLAQPAPPLRWRIKGWQPRESRVMVAAAFKGGKTTLRGNLARSLVDGTPFLGAAPVAPLTGVLVDLDVEMSAWQLEDWYRALAIREADRVVLVSLRGRARAFDLLDAGVRAEWAARFRALQAEYLTLDCLRPILDALGIDEHKDAGRFLVAFDELLKDAGIAEALVVHHMGHVNERARGDSRLRDWPDVEWRLVRQDDDPASARFLSVYGRDVDVPEGQLTYDPATRSLTLLGGSRRDSKVSEVLAAVVDVLAHTEPRSGRAIKAALAESEHGRNRIDEALRYGVRSGALVAEDGAYNAKLYRRVSQCTDVSRSCTGDTACECPAPYRKRDTRTLDFEGVVSQPFDPHDAFGREPSECPRCGRDTCGGDC